MHGSIVVCYGPRTKVQYRWAKLRSVPVRHTDISESFNLRSLGKTDPHR